MGCSSVEAMLDLAGEPISAHRLGQFAPQDFDRHLRTALLIRGTVHRGHATLTDHSVNYVATAEDGAGFDVGGQGASGYGL